MVGCAQYFIFDLVFLFPGKLQERFSTASTSRGTVILASRGQNPSKELLHRSFLKMGCVKQMLNGEKRRGGPGPSSFQ
jgi:hypothetical protein